jgi:hypothetical protein
VTGTLILDCEAVQALKDPQHPKHARAADLLAANAIRGRRGAATTLRIVVPVAVRIEAGWDRSAAAAGNINRLTQAGDVPCLAVDANRGARLRADLPKLSVVDATIGVVAASSPPPVRIMTSDVADMTELLGHLSVRGSAIRL